MTEDAAAEAPKRKMSFRKSGPKRPKLPVEEAKRQGDITQLAFLLLGGKDGAIAFLNNVDPGIDARPLDLAIASEEGYRRVERLIRQKTEGTP